MSKRKDIRKDVRMPCESFCATLNAFFYKSVPNFPTFIVFDFGSFFFFFFQTSEGEDKQWEKPRDFGYH